MKVTAILLLMYWGTDGRSSMLSAEFNSMESCEVARVAAEKKMGRSWGTGVYAVCTEK